ncbi:MAG TPA: GC-type dockerin domain-anchored protein [Phycisphaerales bacterium]|nr:GC-type dockerin domain-anchored protein [Phycisphaerales bacterium]
MNSKTIVLALATLAGGTAALATPQESFDYVALNGGAPLIATGAVGAGNSTGSATAVGAYTVNSVTLTGNISTWGFNTYGSETRVQVTRPDGSTVVLGPFSPLTSTPPGPVSFSVSLNVMPGAAAGSWTVEPYETFNDAGDDATYDALTLTLDDAAIPVGTPDSFTDLGDFTLANRMVDQVINNTAGNEVRWFKLKLPAVTAGNAGHVDIFCTNADPTQPIGPTEMDDPDLALYNAVSAQLVAYDDLDGPGFFGQLSFGGNIPRPATTIEGQAAGLAFTGADGALAEGFYFLAVGQYNMAHPADVTGNWGAVTSNNTGALVDTVLHVRTQLDTTPFPPSATGTVTPPSVEPGNAVVYAVTVTPGGNPVSTGITVTGDLTSLGGGSSVAFHDDGLNGDDAAGDGIYSYSYTVPAATAGGGYTVPVVIADAQGRTANISLTSNVFSPIDLGEIGAGAGGTEVVTTIDVPIAAPGSVVWYVFSTAADALNASTNYMDIDTEPSADDGPPAVGSINDTEIGLYMPDGTLVDADDDDGSDFHSQLTYGDNVNIRPAFGNGFPGDGFDGDLAAGEYYIAVGIFNTIFNAGFDVTSTATATGTVQLNFRTNMPGGSRGPICGAADLGSVGGVAPGDDHLDNNDFVVFIDFFFAHNALADQGSTGGVAGADGVYDNNDFVVFIDNFFNAPASCR